MGTLNFLILVTLITWSSAQKLEKQIKLNLHSNIETVLDDDPKSSEFLKLENNFFKAFNSSKPGNIKTFSELLQVVDSDKSTEMGKLLVQGFMMGMSHKDPDKLFQHFWGQFMNRISPQLAHSINEYKDFFKGMDVFSLPAYLQILFQEDELGNSLAGLPLGYLIDLVQPGASKYGIDIKSVINGIIGMDGSNFPKVVSMLLDNFDRFLSSVIKMRDQTLKNSPSVTGDKTEKKQKKKDNLGALKLFKPFFANLLKQNHIDLDIDAVFDVIDPFLGNFPELLPQLMSMMGGEMDGASLMMKMLPLLGQLGAQGKKDYEHAALDRHADLMPPISSAPLNEKEKQAKESKLKMNDNKFDLNGIGSILNALAGGGGGNQMNAMGLLGMASQFLAQPSKKSKNPPKDEDVKKNTISLGDFAQTAVKFATEGYDTSTVLLKAAEALGKLGGNVKTEPKKTKTETMKSTKQSTSQVPKKYLIDAIKPVLASIQKDKKCHTKINSLFDFGKGILAKRSVGVSDLKNLLLPIISEHVSKDTEFAKNLLSFSKKDWIKFAINMNNDDFRKQSVKSGVKYVTDVLKLISKKDVRNKLYSMAMPNIEEVLKSWGMTGLTLENFPARLGPMIGIMTKNMELPFNPVTLLVPMKNQLVYMQDWCKTTLNKVEVLSESQISQFVEHILDAAFQGLGDFAYAVENPSCLPRSICLLQNNPAPRLYAARIAAVLWGFAEAAEKEDAMIAINVAQSALTHNDCKKTFPGNCPAYTSPIKIKQQKSKMHVHTDL